MPKVQICGHGYAVWLDHEYHWVAKDQSCTCDEGPNCPAVDAVRRYRQAGGRMAPPPDNGYELTEPPADFLKLQTQAPPQVCPICGGPTAWPTNGSPCTWVCQQDGKHWWHWRVMQVARPMSEERAQEWADLKAWQEQAYQNMMALYADAPPGRRTVFC